MTQYNLNDIEKQEIISGINEYQKILTPRPANDQLTQDQRNHQHYRYSDHIKAYKH